MPLPLFPLYPSVTFLKYNVSLAIPGPKLWDLPSIGDFAKKSNYPNTMAAILIPDVEYIRRFANYELGISDAMLSAMQQENLARIKDPVVKETFLKFSGNKDSRTGAFRQGMGLSSVEKTILASAFETQKPYFEIAQFVIKSVVKIEDIIARICPLLGAAINPTMALAIKSRKPKGNGPMQPGSVLGPHGTPQALGYKGGDEVIKKLDKLNTELQRGDNVKIAKDGKYTKVPKPFNNENTTAVQSDNNLSNLTFTFVTISTVYSTGVFDIGTEYLYKYYDIESDQDLAEIVTPPPPPEPDPAPNRVIFGIYRADGTPMNPTEKIKYWAPTSDGLDLQVSESIFEVAPWIKNEKWILDKAIDYPGLYSWRSLEIELYKWKRGSEIKTQLLNPNTDASPSWQKLKYRDVIDFNTEKYQDLKFKENEYITEFTQATIDDYRRYYDYIVEKNLIKFEVPPEDRPDVISQVEKLFSDEAPNDKILEMVQNLVQFGDFKNSYYLGTDVADWKEIRTDLPAPTDSFPIEVRKIFKPMRFNLNGEIVWIDPEDEYDLKVIKVVPTLRLDYSGEDASSPTSTPTGIKKNSEITNFVKNKIRFNVIDPISGQNINFCMKKYRTNDSEYSESSTQLTLENISLYDENNWNIRFNEVSSEFLAGETVGTGDKQIDNTGLAVKLYFNSQSGYPLVISNLFNLEWISSNIITEAVGQNYLYFPDSNYVDGTFGDNPEFGYSTLSFLDNISRFLELANDINTSDSEFSKRMSEWGLDWNKEKFTEFYENSNWVIDKINDLGNVSVEVEVTDKFEYSELIHYIITDEPKFETIEYEYRTKKVIRPLIFANAVSLLYQGVAFLIGSLANPILLISAGDKIIESIEKFKEAKVDFRYYIRRVIPSTKTTQIDEYERFKGSDRGYWQLKLQNGVIKEFIFYKGVITTETTESLGYLFNSQELTLPQNIINGFGEKLLPRFGRDNIVTFTVGIAGNINIPLFQNDLTIYQKSKVSIVSNVLEKFQISIFEENGASGTYKNIKSSNYGVSSILNWKLQELGKQTNPYSKGRYGAGWQGGPVKDNNGNVVHNEPDNPQYVGYIRRAQLTELDLEPYYILEGYKKKENEKEDDDLNGGGSGDGGGGGAGTGGGAGGGGGFYKMPAAVGIAKVMVELVIELAIKLFPAINKLIALLKNPAAFVTEIIKAKLEDHFLIFSPRVTQIMNEVESRRQNFKKLTNEDDKYFALKDMKSFVKGTELGNYLYVDEKADFRFVIDGPAVIGFFGILFGLDLNLTKAFSGGIPIKPIFSVSPSSGTLDNFFNAFGLNDRGDKVSNGSIYGDAAGTTDDKTQKDLEDKFLTNLDLNKPDKVDKNKVVSSNGKIEYYEEVSITYSTGKFIKDVDYKYIYINQQIDELIREADNLINEAGEINFSGTASNPLDSYQLASEKLQQAYDLVDEGNENKDSLRKLLQDKIKLLKGKINIVSNPLFKLILGIVTLPLKVIFSIIKWLIDFFKKLTNPLKFPGLIVEFLTFQWIMQFFTPKGLLELAGIKFKPEKLLEWCVAVNVKNPLFGQIPGMTEYVIPDDYIIADLNEFLNVGFEVTLPSFTAKQYRDLCLRPFRLFNVFFCLIEKLINAFIMLIWAVMGITAVIPPPLLKLCKRIPENLDEDVTPNMAMQDLRDLINGLYKDDDLNVADPNLSTEDLQKQPTGGYDFIYEVTLPDGTVRKDLDREAVQKIMNKNKDLNFDFLNFETLE
jgi:hypothetical protein